MFGRTSIDHCQVSNFIKHATEKRIIKLEIGERIWKWIDMTFTKRKTWSRMNGWHYLFISPSNETTLNIFIWWKFDLTFTEMNICSDVEGKGGGRLRGKIGPLDKTFQSDSKLSVLLWRTQKHRKKDFLTHFSYRTSPFFISIILRFSPVFLGKEPTQINYQNSRSIVTFQALQLC